MPKPIHITFTFTFSEEKNVLTLPSTFQGVPIVGYRNSVSDCGGPPSPNSPMSPHSYSPAGSPNMPPTTLSGSPFADNYYMQQQAQLQHQFEQFNMVGYCVHCVLALILIKINLIDTEYQSGAQVLIIRHGK